MNRSDKVKILLEVSNPNIKYDGTNRVKDISVNAIKNTQTNLWHLGYDAPATTPVSLQQQFTNLNRLVDFASDYYKKKNLKIKEMKDL